MKPRAKSSLALNLRGIFVSAFMFSSKTICDDSRSLLASPVSCRTLPLAQYTIPPNPWIEIINQYVLASFFNLHLFQRTLPETPIGVSQSVDLGRSNNPNTTPTKDYEKVRVVVCLRGVQRGCAEEGGEGIYTNRVMQTEMQDTPEVQEQ